MICSKFHRLLPRASLIRMNGLTPSIFLATFTLMTCKIIFLLDGLIVVLGFYGRKFCASLSFDQSPFYLLGHFGWLVGFTLLNELFATTFENFCFLVTNRKQHMLGYRTRRRVCLGNVFVDYRLNSQSFWVLNGF